MLAKVACDYLSKVDVSDMTDKASAKVRGVYEWRVKFTTGDAAPRAPSNTTPTAASKTKLLP